MLPKGTILGHYRLLQRIGVGGMGEVYLAEDTRIARQVAIKVVSTEAQPYPNSATAQESSRLFQREMRAIATLDHRNILNLIDFGEETIEGMPVTYMIMPYRKERCWNTTIACLSNCFGSCRYRWHSSSSDKCEYCKCNSDNC